MKLIAAVSEKWGIGKDGDLLFHIPSDMKFFRETTKNSVVIMGRKTLESFPGGKPLKNRVNIVITSDANYETEAVVCTSVEQAVSESEKYPDKEVFVIGGGSIYNAMLDYCDSAYITKVFETADADTYFPDLDHDKNWNLAEESEITEDNGHKIKFCIYRRTN